MPKSGAEARAAVVIGQRTSRVGSKVRIRVHYPLEGGRIVLRTDDDWDRDLELRSVTEDGTCFEFEFETSRPFVYFKPVLVRNGDQRWSEGRNYLVLRSAERPSEVYPTFYSDGKCSACDLRELRSPTLNVAHTYRVFYPPGYTENPLRRYPVLYMQDGQNLFFPGEAFGGHHWRVGETLSLLADMNAIERVIVVGVYPNQREIEYTRPGYETYGRYLVEALKPAIDAEFRTLAEARHTAVMGSSLGGVVSFYLAWQWPQVFGMAACLSSTFTWRDDIRERVAAEPRRDIRLYLDSGWPRDNYELTRDMRTLLLSRGYLEGRDLLYFAFPEALHNEMYWAMRSHIPYQFFFGGVSGGVGA